MTERDCENYKHHISRDCENCCESAEPIQAIQDCRNCKYGKYNDHWENYFCYHDKECNNWDLWESAEPTMPMFAESEQAYKAWTGEDMGKPSDLISRHEALEQMAQAVCGLHYEDCEADNCSCSYISRILNLPSAEKKKWNTESATTFTTTDLSKESIFTSNTNGVDLISRAEAIKVLSEFYEYSIRMVDEVTDLLNSLPSVSAERVGEWSEYKDEYHGGIMGNCSCCGKSTYNAISYDLNGNRHQYHYCPNCGARMENKK